MKMDLSEEEMLEFFDDLDDEIEEKWGISVVEIDYGSVDCKKQLQIALSDLNIQLNQESPLWEEVLADLMEISREESRIKMTAEYIKKLQKPYSNNSEIPHLDVKRIIKTAAPKIIKEAFQVTLTEPFMQISVTEDDEKVIEYLAGGLLKWGMKRLGGEGASWCESHASVRDLPDCFQERNRGGLISASETFVRFLISVEREFRSQVCKRIIDERRIIGNIDMDPFSPSESSILTILVRRFIRTRAHIHCNTELQNNVLKKTTGPKSYGLRDALKDCFSK
ncbi:uncharacterized protein LOC120327130 [Styela clava]|uniref:uncharacterized protein LOC120327130 n=1 Tax=Styela clava TaxID=7725 RepID=UPI00193AC7F4|nr:uncharacterized protein LOC120327130 [Styela clava]